MSLYTFLCCILLVTSVDSAEKSRVKIGESLSQPPLTVDKPITTGCGHNGRSVAEGETVEIAQFWYVCIGGNLTASGCLSDGKRVKLGEKFPLSSMEVTCSSNGPGRMKLIVTGCIHGGKTFVAGDSFEDKFFWYQCASINGSLVTQVGGCVDESGQRVTLGNTVKTSNYLFQCLKGSEGQVQFKPVACLKDGQQYKVGEPFTVGQFWYSCAQENGFVTTKLSGCVGAEGQRLVNGEKYRKNGFVVECQISAGHSVAHTIVGCVPNEPYGSPAKPSTQLFSYNHTGPDGTDDANVTTSSNQTRVARESDSGEEKKLGETWLAGNPPFRFVVKCEKLETGARQSLVKCHYEGPEGTHELSPGCYRHTKAFVITCFERPDGGLSMNTVAIVKGSNPILERQGLKEC